jgi:hypothetical protein
VKHSRQVALEGPHALDGFEQFLPQGSVVAPSAAPCPPAAPDDVKNQQGEKHNSQPHRKPQHKRLISEYASGRGLPVISHMRWLLF